MNKELLIKLLECAALSYFDKQPILPGEKLYTIDSEKTGIQCYIRKKNDMLIISFRGTDSCKDWLTDLKFWKKVIPYNNTSSRIRVHAGFINAYKSEEVRGRIMEFVTPDIYFIRITGHSLGAALSVLCAVDLQYNFPKKDIEVALFGCPRVGNKAFAESYNKRIFKTLRVENGNDIVTKIPPCILGYYHVGIRIHIGMPRIIGVFSTLDHYTQKYYENLWRKINFN